MAINHIPKRNYNRW